jgi:hypothetical protein
MPQFDLRLNGMNVLTNLSGILAAGFRLAMAVGIS